MKKREQPWDRTFQLFLVLIVGFNIIPHIPDLSTWATGISLLFLGWKILYLYRGLPTPPKFILWPLSVLGVVAIFAQSDLIISPEPATAALVFLATAKILETNRYRDGMFVLCASYFLLMAHLLFSQSLVSTLIMIGDVVLLTFLMYLMHKKDRRNTVLSFLPILKIVGVAVPVWIFLFVVFPRFSTGLMNFQTAPRAQTGLSDSLNPGSIAKLIESDGIAFRAEFNSQTNLLPQDLYWRGYILNRSDGLMWTAGARDKVAKIAPAFLGAASNRYEIWLEPTFARNLIALDYSDQPSINAGYRDQFTLSRDLLFETRGLVIDRVNYFAVRRTNQPQQKLTLEQREIYLQVPQLPDEVTTLANQLRAASTKPTAAAYAQSVLRWFKSQKFSYSLSPGMLSASRGPAQLADFLLKTKIGFCEHYAAAFATLLRAMGIPARVVLGYQGGTLNEFGNYILVRHLDAHAWTEIWSETDSKTGLGEWLRFDPTAVIAPLRIEMGGDFNRLSPSLAGSNISADEARRSMHGYLGYFYRSLMLWDLMQQKWNSFLLDYNADLQRRFLERLGLSRFSSSYLLLFAIIGLAFFGYGLIFILRRQAHRHDPVAVAWRKMCRRLETTTLQKQASEGPLHFAQRAVAEWPDHADDIRRLSQQFANSYYGSPNSASTEQRKQFIQQSRLFVRRLPRRIT